MHGVCRIDSPMFDDFLEFGSRGRSLLRLEVAESSKIVRKHPHIAAVLIRSGTLEVGDRLFGLLAIHRYAGVHRRNVDTMQQGIVRKTMAEVSDDTLGTSPVSGHRQRQRDGR